MLTLKRSYIVLLGGVGILVAGSIVLGVNSSVLATDFLTNNMIIKKETIAPGEEFNTVMTSQSGGSVSVLMRGQPFNGQIKASVLDKDGKSVWANTFNGDHVSNFNAKQGQTYKITIKNIDKTDVTVDAIIGNVPFMGLSNDSSLPNVAGTLVGLGVGILGIITLIAGGFLFFVDRAAKKKVITPA